MQPRLTLRQRGRLAFLLVCVLGALARRAAAIDVPPLQHRVTDQAQLLQRAQRAQLEQQLAAYEQRTGRQFALLTVATLGDEPIDMFGIRVAEAWRLGRKQGSKDFSDGLILIVVAGEHRSRIEVGYGLEADITDALSRRVVQNVLRPAFRAQKYYEGIEQAFDVLMRAADKSPVEGALPARDAGALEQGDTVKLGFWVLLAVVVLLLVGPRAGLDMLLVLLNASQGSGRRGGSDQDRFSGGGGSFGGGGASGDW